METSQGGGTFDSLVVGGNELHLYSHSIGLSSSTSSYYAYCNITIINTSAEEFDNTSLIEYLTNNNFNSAYRGLTATGMYSGYDQGSGLTRYYMGVITRIYHVSSTIYLVAAQPSSWAESTTSVTTLTYISGVLTIDRDIVVQIF